MSYDKAYNEWDAMTVKERIDWCHNIGEEIDEEIACLDADEVSEKYYCFWTTIREILMED